MVGSSLPVAGSSLSGARQLRRRVLAREGQEDCWSDLVALVMCQEAPFPESELPTEAQQSCVLLR